MMRIMRRVLRTTILTLVPPQFRMSLWYRYYGLRGWLEPEMYYVERLLRRRRRFLDIGAGLGTYSYYLSPKFVATDAFEPVPGRTTHLRQWDHADVTIHNIALSNAVGRLELHIPIRFGGLTPDLSSLESPSPPTRRVSSMCGDLTISILMTWI